MGPADGYIPEPCARWVRFGAEALDALRTEVDGAKAGDPLAPVTVIVPGPAAGVILRRAWARDRGYANLRFVTLAAVAERLATRGLRQTGRVRALGRLERLAAVVAAQRDQAAPAAAQCPLQPASITALDRRVREVGDLDDVDRDALRAGGAALVVDLASRVAARTAGRYGAADLVAAAVDEVRSGGPDVAALGRVVVYLPEARSAAERRLIVALVSHAGATVLLGATGESAADATGGDLLAGLRHAGCEVADAPVIDGAAPAAALHWLPDPDAEARFVARHVLALVEQGTPPDRIAVLYRQADPYARMLRYQLGAAGLPLSIGGRCSLAQTVAGRTLCGLLGLPGVHYSRQAVMAVLAGAPIRRVAGGELVPLDRWERIARNANVVGRPERWTSRLATYERRHRARAAGGPGADGTMVRADEAAALSAFVSELVEQVAAATAGARSWSEAAEGCRGLLDRYLDPTHLDDLARAELEAVSSAIDEVAALDGWLPLRTEEILPVLHLALDRSVSRSGRVGEGVFVGALGETHGAGFDHLVVVGMNEGTLPARRADDPLVPDRVRAGSVGLPDRRQARAAERRVFLAASAGATCAFTAAAADPRLQRPLLPSSWFLAAAARPTVRPPCAADVIAGVALGVTSVPSFAALLDERPSTREEAVAAALRGAADPAGAAARAGMAALADGLRAVQARATLGLSPWEGLVGRRPSLQFDPGHLTSPTTVQYWAECPRRYLLTSVLHVAETARPEDTIELAPMDFGTLVHAALEDFFRARVAEGRVGDAWGPGDLAELLAAAERRCAEAEARGLTGLAVPWEAQRRQLVARLTEFLPYDADRRSPDGLAPADLEVGFGSEDDPIGPVPISTGRRTVRFRGRIDRIDTNADRSVVHVLDYKTGKSQPFAVLDRDPVASGRYVQLPVYALAAQQAYPDAAITASYWFVTEAADAARERRVPLTDETRARLGEVLDAIVDGIEDGLFPANPGDADRDSWTNCRRCPYERVCPTDRDDVWARVALDPAADPYQRLAAAEVDG